MKTRYFVGTDIGTSGTKTILVDTAGRVVSSSQEDYGILTPRALWAEQWPDVWLRAVKRTIREAVRKSGVVSGDVAGICISGLYGGSGIPCDDAWNAVRPCIIWMDRRADAQSRWVAERVGLEKLYEVTHNGADPYYGFTKILWIRDNEPANWARIKQFLPPNAFVIQKLTSEVAIDFSSAGNIGGIFDLQRRNWSTELLDAMEIPGGMMPDRIVPSSEIVGGLTREAAGELGLPIGTPVCAGGVDCVVATLGLGVLEPGEHVAVIGTSMTWGFVHRGSSESKNLICMPYVKDPESLLFTFGGAATAGALPKWFRDNFAELEKRNEAQAGTNAYQALEAAAAQVAPGSDGLIVLPYFMGERSPIWDVHARGTILGLSLHHTKAHVYRAFLESVAYSLRHTMENVRTGTHLGERLILAGGVTRSKLWKQIFADVTGYPVVCPDKDVEANMGDVLLAGAGTGLLNYSAAGEWLSFGDQVVPDANRRVLYDRYYELYKATYQHLKGTMKDMSALLSDIQVGGLGSP